MPTHLANPSGVLAALPWLDFARPGWLLLIPPLLALAVWIARNAFGGWHGGRQTVVLLIRCTVLTLLCIAIAEPSIERRASDLAVVVVRDMSKSVPVDQQRAADAFIQSSLARKRPADRLGVVTVAHEAVVQSLPAASKQLPESTYIGETDATNLQGAIALARATIPAEAGGRVLLITDGNQTDGDLAAAVREAGTAGIAVDVAAVEYDRSGMIRVRELVVPAWAREGETVSARVVIDAGRPAKGRLSLTRNGDLLDIDPDPQSRSVPVQLEPGLNVLTYPLRLNGASVHSIEAFFEPEPDDPDNINRSSDAHVDVPELLRASAVTFTSSKARVLVLSDKPETLGPFLGSIRTDEFSVDIRSVSEAPSSLTDLIGYDAVVLADVPASSLSQTQQSEFVQFVRDAGGGLLVLGGPDSYGAGGWIGSPLAEALPVRLDPPQTRQMPLGALALVIDCSGSMAAPVSGTKLNQQEIANEAAILGVRALSRLDQVAVIAFSGGFEVVVPLTLRGEPEAIAKQIRSIGPGGGTDLFPAIDAAAAELAKSPAGVKHIIILSDGQTMGEPADGLARAADLKERGVTVSTVSIGDAAAGGLLAQIALVGGGRPYTVTSANSLAQLPQIFIKEAQIVRRSLIWEGPAFTPQRTGFSESLRGVTGAFPGITGYVVAADRGGLSTVLLRGPENDPILAQWQHGLGRVTTFASDATTRWNAQWTGWESFASFWKQQVRWVARPTGDPRSRVAVINNGDRSRVYVDLMDDDGEPLNFSQIRGRVIHHQPRGAVLVGQGTLEPAADVTLRQVGPGRYEGEIETKYAGVHVISLGYEGVGNSSEGTTAPISGTLRAAVVRRAGHEMEQTTPNTELLWQLASSTNGRMYRLDPAGADLWVRDHLAMPTTSRAIWMLVALAAIAMFLIDVAVRRIAVDAQQVNAWARALLAPSRPAGGDGLAALTAMAKARTTGGTSPTRSATPGSEQQWGGSAQDPYGPEDIPSAPIEAAVMPSHAVHQARDTPSDSHPRETGLAADEPEDRMTRLRAAKKRSRLD